MSRRAAVFIVLAALGSVLTATAASSAQPDPTIQLSTGHAAVGDRIIATVQGWLEVTTVAICGNNAQRGAVDCDQVSGVGLPASGAGPTQQILIVTRPPVPCPCVARAVTAGESLVRTAPLEITGVPTAPLVAAPAADAINLKISARAVGTGASFFDRLRSLVGGPTRRMLLLQVQNVGSTSLTGLNVSAAVGRDTQTGEPLSSPDLTPLAPGEARSYRVPVSLSAPSFGTYRVFGTVYGAGLPVSFSTTTSTAPWALFGLLLVLVADVVAMASFSVRRRRRRREAPESTRATPSVQLPFALDSCPVEVGATSRP